MRSKNVTALTALFGVLLFERLAYYTFRGSFFARAIADGRPAASVATLSAFVTLALVLGFVAGALTSLFVRHRAVLAGAVVAIAAAHAVGALSATAGGVLLALAGGFVRPLVMAAAAEELGAAARPWQGAFAGAGLSIAADVGGLVSGLAVGALQPRFGFLVALPVVLSLFTVVCAAAVAFGFPGAPFAWSPPAAHLVPGDGLYRAEPALVRTGGAPSLAVLALPAIAVVVGAWERSFGYEIAYKLESARLSGRLAIAVETGAGIVGAVVVLALALVHGASAPSRSSPTTLLGAGLVGAAVGSFSLAGAALAGAGGLGLLAGALSGLGHGVLGAVALGYALSTTASRFVGLVTAAMAILQVAPSLFRSVPVALGSGAPFVLVFFGLVLVAAGVASIVAGPGLEKRGSAPE